MPQLSDRFSAYPVTTRLDSNGDGSIRFQAQGKNIVITNLYVSVATQTAQAKCTIYKQNVGPQWALDTTNSGSTGASARGRIELLDGEAVHVVWDGGDANTIATATFTGYALPFNVPVDSGTDFVWADPIAAGDGSLIYPAIKSPDFVAGVSGWSIERDGDVEFNDGTFRGSIIVEEADGSGIEIVSNDSTIYLTPPTSEFFTNTAPGRITTDIFNNPLSGYAYVVLESPEIDSGAQSSIFLGSESDNGNPAFMSITGETNFNNDVTMAANLDVEGTATGVPGSRINTDLNTSDSATFTTTETELQSVTALLENGKRYKIFAHARFSSSVAGDAVIERIRQDDTSGTELASGQIGIPTTSAVGFGPMPLYAEYLATSDGLKTFIFSGQRNAGTGNITMRASAVAPARIFVDRR